MADTKQELLDLRVYGKGMETHITAKSALIGSFITDHAQRTYGDVQTTTVPDSVATLFGGARVKLQLMDIEDERFSKSGNGSQTYGYYPFNTRGNGFLERCSVGGYSARTLPNSALFCSVGLTDGIHIRLPRYIGQDRIDMYVKDMREEAEWFFNAYLKPVSRRVRIYVETYKTV